MNIKLHNFDHILHNNVFFLFFFIQINLGLTVLIASIASIVHYETFMRFLERHASLKTKKKTQT